MSRGSPASSTRKPGATLCRPGDTGPVPGLVTGGLGGADSLPDWEKAHTTVIPTSRHIPNADSISLILSLFVYKMP